MQPTHRAILVRSLVATLPAMSALGGCGEREQRTDADPTTMPRLGPREPAEARSPTVEQVRESPGRFYGDRVQVSGEVDELFGERAFELEGTGWAFGDDITVLTRTPVKFDGDELRREDELVVMGIVRPFVVAEIERDLGWDLTPELEARLREHPVLVADAIRRTTEYGRWSATETAEGPAPLTSVVSAISTTNPHAVAGRKVEFRREQVRAVMGRGLWVGPNIMSQVFVLPLRMPSGLQAGDFVRVTGTLREAPRDAARGWDLPADMAGVVREDALFVDAATVEELPAGEPRPGT